MASPTIHLKKELWRRPRRLAKDAAVENGHDAVGERRALGRAQALDKK
jgi:hypothetical protein